MEDTNWNTDDTIVSQYDPLDVWVAFDTEADEEPTYEANTYRNEDGTYRVEWYHTGVGQVSVIGFSCLSAAYCWYYNHGYIDLSA